MNVRSRGARLLREAVGRTGPVEPTESDWDHWVEFARVERVLPLLHHLISTADTDVTMAQRESLAAIQLAVMGNVVRLEHGLLDIAEAFESWHLEFAVLKGVATAHLDYHDPALRQFGDVDLLVSSTEFDRACSLLEKAGWRQAYPLPRHHEKYTHAMTFRDSRRVEIDLHQRIAHRAIGELIPTGDLLDRRVTYNLAGRSLPALAKQDRLIHAAVHTVASRGSYRRLSSVADVLVLADSNSSTAATVLERAESWRVRALVEHAIRFAFEEAQLPVPPEWGAAMSLPTSRRDRLVDLAYLSPQRRPALEELAYLRLMPGWWNRATYLRGYFSTDSDYARKNERTGVISQSRYLWSRLRSGRSA